MVRDHEGTFFILDPFTGGEKLMTDIDLSNILTEREVAKLLRISPSGVRNLRISGLLGHIRAGKRVLYTRSHVEEFLRRHECPAEEKTAA